MRWRLVVFTSNSDSDTLVQRIHVDYGDRDAEIPYVCGKVSITLPQLLDDNYDRAILRRNELSLSQFSGEIDDDVSTSKVLSRVIPEEYSPQDAVVAHLGISPRMVNRKFKGKKEDPPKVFEILLTAILTETPLQMIFCRPRTQGIMEFSPTLLSSIGIPKYDCYKEFFPIDETFLSGRGQFAVVEDIYVEDWTTSISQSWVRSSAGMTPISAWDPTLMKRIQKQYRAKKRAEKKLERERKKAARQTQSAPHTRMNTRRGSNKNTPRSSTRSPFTDHSSTGSASSNSPIPTQRKLTPRSGQKLKQLKDRLSQTLPSPPTFPDEYLKDDTETNTEPTSARSDITTSTESRMTPESRITPTSEIESPRSDIVDWSYFTSPRDSEISIDRPSSISPTLFSVSSTPSSVSPNPWTRSSTPRTPRRVRSPSPLVMMSNSVPYSKSAPRRKSIHSISMGAFSPFSNSSTSVSVAHGNISSDQLESCLDQGSFSYPNLSLPEVPTNTPVDSPFQGRSPLIPRKIRLNSNSTSKGFVSEPRPISPSSPKTRLQNIVGPQVYHTSDSLTVETIPMSPPRHPSVLRLSPRPSPRRTLVPSRSRLSSSADSGFTQPKEKSTISPDDPKTDLQKISRVRASTDSKIKSHPAIPPLQLKTLLVRTNSEKVISPISTVSCKPEQINKHLTLKSSRSQHARQKTERIAGAVGSSSAQKIKLAKCDQVDLDEVDRLRKKNPIVQLVPPPISTIHRHRRSKSMSPHARRRRQSRSLKL